MYVTLQVLIYICTWLQVLDGLAEICCQLFETPPLWTRIIYSMSVQIKDKIGWMCKLSAYIIKDSTEAYLYQHVSNVTHRYRLYCFDDEIFT